MKNRKKSFILLTFIILSLFRYLMADPSVGNFELRRDNLPGKLIFKRSAIIASANNEALISLNRICECHLQFQDSRHR